MPVKLSWDNSLEEKEDSAIVDLDFSLDSFGHTLIKGDNYPVLKSLIKKGLRLDLIYIDPPYNTGKEFAYNDRFSEDAWLSFMNKRLLLAKELMKDSACIYIAIDQSELYVLKLLCDQIFGTENFVNDFMWLHGKGKKDKWSRTLQQHTLCYARDKSQLRAFRETEYSDWAKTNADGDSRGNWFSGSISFSEKRSNPHHHNYYSITSPSGKIWTRQWQLSQEEMQELIKNDLIYWGPEPAYDGVPRKKIFNDTETQVIPRNIIENVESTRSAQNHLDKLLGQKGLFENPKPVDLITHLIKISQMPSDALIMDFFAGSGTTFEAVCLLNKEDSGNRRCLLVQKDENGIAEITRRRCEKVSAIYKTKIDML